MEKSGQNKKKPTFEESVARIDEIVAKLEQGDVPLDDALGLFEEGTALVKKCLGMLDKAEQRVLLLTKADQDGQPVTEPFSEQ